MRIPKWKEISVEKYQYINEITTSEMSDIDKLLYIITFLTGKTEEQIDKISLKQFTKLKDNTEKLFSTMDGQPVDQLKGFSFTYNFKQITLGQYIEVQHFIKGGQIENLHLIASSFSKKANLDHTQRAEQIQKLPFLPVLHSVGHFMEQLNEFNGKYKGLFGISEEDGEQEQQTDKGSFNDRYGWIYSAKKVAEFEGIPLEKAFDLPVIQAFNDLSYLKALGQHEAELNKKSREQF